MLIFKNKKYLYVLILILLIFFVRQFAFYDNDIHTQEEGYRLYLYSSINKGALLYRDIGYYLGIISPYFYGFIFKIFGEFSEEEYKKLIDYHKFSAVRVYLLKSEID